MCAYGALPTETPSCQSSDRARHRQELAIARHDVCDARQVYAETGYDGEKARRAVAGILLLSKGLTLGGLKIRDLVGEGRP